MSLGYNIVVKMHDGSIPVNNSEGKGSEFYNNLSVIKMILLM